VPWDDDRVDAAGLHELISRSPLIADGGMGTSLIERGAPVGACFEAFSADEPDRVRAVHRGFVEAGAQLILTNTFGANRFRLARHGAQDRVLELNSVAPRIAREAGAQVVGGSVGPLGVRLAPYGRVRPEEAAGAYAEQISALAEGGADVIVIETQTDLREMEQALLAARSAAPGLAAIVSATFTRDDRTLLGSSPEEVASRLVELGADVIGVNCGEGPAQILRVVRAMRRFAGSTPIAARPNAGGPREVAGRFVYPATPAYVGEHAKALIAEGVSIVGGCCGTGPAHTAAIAEAVRAGGAAAGAPVSDVLKVAGDPIEPACGPTVLQSRLEEGRFVVAVEMEPPRSYSTATLVAAAETLSSAGADVIDVADSPMARMRMSPWAACRLIQERAGIETVLHFPTRGRNLLRLQGDLLAVHALGIRNIFVCLGDPVSIGDFPRGSNNVDVTATGLLSLINEEFNFGRDRGGSSIGAPTAFFTGAAVSPNAPDLQHECRLLEKKVKAGARFVLSQPLFGSDDLSRLLATFERTCGRPLDVPVLAGVLPLVTARHAEFLHNEVPGIEIPDAVLARIRSAGEDAWREGVKLAGELAQQLRIEGAAGIYVMPQFGRFDLAADVVEAARAAANA
jgi:methionine synthase I (cobalamin-dependent)/5,10-methylenetetrahydrofolate reductase